MKKTFLSVVAVGVAAISTSAVASVDVPAGARYRGQAHATGYQIYECGDNYQWAFRAPSADLTFTGRRMAYGIHYGGIDYGLTPGPYWQRDQSAIRGQAIANEPNPGSIPLLLLQVAEHIGTGYFDNVAYIQRLNTTGGVGPTGDCDNPGELSFSEYTADYYFYSAW